VDSVHAISSIDALAEAITKKATSQRFIVGIDGMDGVGKTTLANLLAPMLDAAVI
jgi:uridine kinase